MMNLLELIILNIFFSFIFLKLFIFFSYKFNFLDKPNSRKKHKKPTPFLGGLSGLITLTLLILIFNSKLQIQIYWIMVFLIIVSLLGLYDDFKNLKAEKKLLLLSISFFFILIFFPDLKIKHISIQNYGHITFNEISSFGITILCYLLYVNSMNMIDGENGLSSSIFITTIIYLLIKIGYSHEYSLILIILLINLIIFFIFNIKSLIFIGNNGIYFYSSILALILIKLHNEKIIFADEIFLLLMIPGIDMLRLFISRIYNGKHPFNSDNNHIHHILKKREIAKNSTGPILIIIIVPLLMKTFFFENNNFLLILLTLIAYLILINLRKNKIE